MALGYVPEDVNKGVLMLEYTEEVRCRKINWQAYLLGNIIKQEGYDLIVALDVGCTKTHDKCIAENRDNVARLFINNLSSISKVDTVEYLLVMLEDIFHSNEYSIQLFSDYYVETGKSLASPFFHLLNRPEEFVKHTTCRIISTLALNNPDILEEQDKHYYFTWIMDTLNLKQESDCKQLIGRCLQKLLKNEQFIDVFVPMNGLTKILYALKKDLNFQVQYQLINSLWNLSLKPEYADLISKLTTIPVLADIISGCTKEKVIRMVLATFHNLLIKPTDSSIIKNNRIALLQFEVLRHLKLIQKLKFTDVELNDDVEYLIEILEEIALEVTSFDAYMAELTSTYLKPGPVHDSMIFWRKNASRFNENNFSAIRMLVNILKTHMDPKILAIVISDIGNYIQYYPKGKKIINDLKGKAKIMMLVEHFDPNVRKEALLCIQKLVLENWQNFYCPLEFESNCTNSKKDTVPSEDD